MSEFNIFLDALSGDDFEETPVTIEEFVTDKNYLSLPPLSDYQYTMLRAMTQIYKAETLIKLYGQELGNKTFKQTCNEVIMQLGKGSGKDYTSTIACAYIVYLLLCLKDPARYSSACCVLDLIPYGNSYSLPKRLLLLYFVLQLSSIQNTLPLFPN